MGDRYKVRPDGNPRAGWMPLPAGPAPGSPPSPPAQRAETAYSSGWEWWRAVGLASSLAALLLCIALGLWVLWYLFLRDCTVTLSDARVTALPQRHPVGSTRLNVSVWVSVHNPSLSTATLSSVALAVSVVQNMTDYLADHLLAYPGDTWWSRPNGSGWDATVSPRDTVQAVLTGEVTWQSGDGNATRIAEAVLKGCFGINLNGEMKYHLLFGFNKRRADLSRSLSLFAPGTCPCDTD
eukprot:TRINITY_DN46889_c0_g1_i1.p1 TRINITY_DN46889_c0_g1~~TRINITY_DN46889_c0_g1_i1.p1  ORF type:complete len:262 (+),score=80.19 TRINITY_DN46889_c0_g1_i1:73-786(+)